MNTSIRRLLLMLAALVPIVGLAGIAPAGDLEPPGPPGPTMKTLDEIPPTWSQKITDGSERFASVLNGQAFLDKETGLVWEYYRDTTPYGWHAANSIAHNKEVGGRKGWRLPTIEELSSLVDTSRPEGAKLAQGAGYGVFYSAYPYWSSTTYSLDTDKALGVRFGDGNAVFSSKTDALGLMWCVRGGHGQ